MNYGKRKASKKQKRITSKRTQQAQCVPEKEYAQKETGRSPF